MPTKKKETSNPADKAEKVLAKMADTWARLAESQAPALIGAVVLEVVAVSGQVSLEAVIAALRAKAADAPSSRGNGSARLDVALLTAEAAIRQLQSVTPSA
jgi:hypothetical protein